MALRSWISFEIACILLQQQLNSSIIVLLFTFKHIIFQNNFSNFPFNNNNIWLQTWCRTSPWTRALFSKRRAYCSVNRRSRLETATTSPLKFSIFWWKEMSSTPKRPLMSSSQWPSCFSPMMYVACADKRCQIYLNLAASNWLVPISSHCAAWCI